MKANIWKITGYKGHNDYDGPEDNNINFNIIMDSRFTKKDIEKIMSQYWSQFYRTVAIKINFVKEIEIKEVL